MDVKHRPGTELPWHALWLSWVQPKDGEPNVSYSELQELHAFALHAVNAYPRLIEALEDTARQLESAAEFAPAKITKELWKMQAEEAHALLRDLGELPTPEAR